MRDLQGQNALVTGASGGLGRHIAGALAASGANVLAEGRTALQSALRGSEVGARRAHPESPDGVRGFRRGILAHHPRLHHRGGRLRLA